MEENKQITSFRDEYFFLSNFYPCEIKIDDITYKSSEAAYQAQKCADPEDREMFKDLKPEEAKKLGRKVKLRDDWDVLKVCVMKTVLQEKFRQNPDIREKLINTHPCDLIEGNTWDDRFWGVCKGKGKNVLGRLLMEVRSYFMSPVTQLLIELLENKEVEVSEF